MSEFNLDFTDTKTAFADKTDAELREKHRLFVMMNSRVLNGIGTRSVELALGVGLPISWVIKHTIFQQFCGGETIAECQPTIDKLGHSNIGTILDYSVEGKTSEDDFERAKEETIRNLQRARDDDDIPFAVFKVTGIAAFGALGEFTKNGKIVKDSHRKKWENAKIRLNEICEFAHSIRQPVFIDAEESWFQGALDYLATEMMRKYNREYPVVVNTVQLYRHDRYDYLKSAHEAAKRDGYHFAVKLVRGAYMEKERERAIERGYPSPIHKNKEATDHDFDKAVDYCLDNIEDISFIAGTHNEASVRYMAERMLKMKLAPNHPNIHFSQLFGMGDNLSYILASKGFNVSKYVPYGPVKDAVPYLIRRARENSSVTGQVSRELDLIKSELSRRRNEK